MSSDIEHEPWRTVEYGNLALVRAVKKRPCLYNNTLPEYSQKDLTRAAWDEIAEEFGCSVDLCKKRWKSLRTGYFRNKYRQCADKNSKPYYLNEEMAFILPFTHCYKLLKNLNTSGFEDIDRVIYYEPSVDDTQIELQQMEANMCSEEVTTLNNNADISCTGSKAAKNISIKKSISKNCKKIKNCKKTPQRLQSISSNELETKSSNEIESRNQFMTSLLPEIYEMSVLEFRTFKRQVFELIDNIKH